MKTLSQVALAAMACCLTNLAQANTTYSAGFSLGDTLPALRTGSPAFDGPDSLPGAWTDRDYGHARVNSRELLSSTVNPGTGALEQTWGQQLQTADEHRSPGHPLSMGETIANISGPNDWTHTSARAEVAHYSLRAQVNLTDRQANADATASWSRGFSLDPHSSFTFSGLATVGITGDANPLATATTFDSNASFASLTLGDLFGRVRTTIGASIWGAAASLGNIFSYSVGPGGRLALTITNNSDIALNGSLNAGSYVAVSAPVPEPETWLLLLAGAGIVGFASRKQKQTHFGHC